MSRFHKVFPPLLLGLVLFSIITTIIILSADAVDATTTVLLGH